MKLQITDNFWLSEFKQPAKHGFKEQPYPKDWLLERLLPLCETLEKIRSHFGGYRVTITGGGGFRSVEYNLAIGGKPKSQHFQGRAADITIKGIPAKVVHDGILAMYEADLIPLLGGLGQYPTFTHVDVRPRAGRLARWSEGRTSN